MQLDLSERQLIATDGDVDPTVWMEEYIGDLCSNVAGFVEVEE